MLFRSVLNSIPREQWPDRVIITGNHKSTDQQEIQRFSERICILSFSGAVSDLLRLLSFQVSLERLDFGIGPCVGAEDALDDVKELIEHHRRALPVVDASGRLCGVIARSDLRKKKSRRAVLIDHFESGQAVPGVEHLEILEVIDHHRIGDIQTHSPIRVDCRPIGSSCSIVALNFFEAGLDPSPQIATLMLGGLCSDTLALTSPTTTRTDVEIANRLCAIAGISFECFAEQLFIAGDDLRTSDPRKIWNRDQKHFSIRNHRFAVAQLETVSVADLSDDILAMLRSELERDFAKSNCLCSLLVLTDVIQSCSLVTFCESSAVRNVSERALQSHVNNNGWMMVPGLVSRKKQVIPAMMEVFAGLRSLEA